MTDPTPEAGPFLEISGPAREPWCFPLSSDRPTTVGRLRGINDIVLTPDPDRLVSGTHHCTIAFEPDPIRCWSVGDTNSRNGTFLRHRGEELEVRGTQVLTDGDLVCLLARLSETQPAAYWELAFYNPAETGFAALVTRLEYDWIGARLFRISGTQRAEIANLRPQVHVLLRYMLRRNRENAASTACSKAELMHAVWGDEPNHSTQELHALILALRSRVELEPASPCFVQTVKGIGYRLDTRPPMGG